MSSKERELDFGDYESSFVKKQTRRETFLAEMEEVVPFWELIRMIEPFYPRVGLQGGRPPYRLEVMLRIHLMQNWNSLSEEAMENDLIDIPCIRRFAGIDLVRGDIPDATTILGFCHFLEKCHVGEKIFQTVVEDLSKKGLLVREGTVVDATVIHAPTSTKNRKKERDPEMHQTRKGNQ